MSLLPLLALSMVGHSPALPELPREFRAAWIASVANIDWPTKPGLTPEVQRRELTEILDLAQRTGLNAVILQIRPVADALYPSTLEPWSEYLTGTQGRAPDPIYDPLEFAIEESHRRGLELHVWFNPYRSRHTTAKSPDAPTHVNVARPDLVRSYGTFKWMDPGEPEVQRRSLEVIRDVVRRYDVDGVHIDDYFYPYPVRDAAGKKIEFPDDPSWRRYVAGGGRLARDDWRRDNVNRFVKRLYEMIKEEKRWVKFGISPFGIYRPGVPSGIRAGIDQYADLYADARLWLRAGWCDYFTPQLYWPIAQTAQAYPALLDWWVKENASERHLWPGNFTSRTNPSEGNWKAEEIAAQVRLTRTRRHATGNVHFSMRALRQNWNGVADALAKEYATPAFVPASPWLDRIPPDAPKASVRGRTVRWEPVEDVRTWAVAHRVNGKWTAWQRTGVTEVSAEPGADAVAVLALDRASNAGGATVITIPTQ